MGHQVALRMGPPHSRDAHTPGPELLAEPEENKDASLYLGDAALEALQHVLLGEPEIQLRHAHVSRHAASAHVGHVVAAMEADVRVGQHVDSIHLDTCEAKVAARR